MFDIAIPSYKRANDCITAKNFSKAIIFCHEFEADDYRKHNKNKIITIPDNLAGKGMAVIRNYILDNTKEEKVLMLDDDIKYIGYYEDLDLFIMSENEAYKMTAEQKALDKQADDFLKKHKCYIPKY